MSCPRCGRELSGGVCGPCLLLEPEDEPFPPDEVTWRRVTALALTACTGVGQAAFVVCISPKVFAADEVRPLVMAGLEPLADGRFISRLRFEEGPILAALAGAAAGAALWALVLRHWRLEGWMEQRSGAVEQGRWMAWLGLFTALTGVLRHVVETVLERDFALVPLAGGLLEVGCLWLFWSGLLEMARTGRRLLDQPGLLVGMSLAMVPPVAALLEYILTWTPG